jgi:hypothetical protein
VGVTPQLDEYSDVKPLERRAFVQTAASYRVLNLTLLMACATIAEQIEEIVWI